jgi:hypothetical protein
LTWTRRSRPRTSRSRLRARSPGPRRLQTAVAEVATDAASALTTHAAVTTSVHGITDTSNLALKTVTVNAQTGTTYTLVLGDASELVTVSNASTHTLTVPTNASVAFATGTVINVARIGAGAVNLAAAGGVTINSPGLGARSAGAVQPGHADKDSYEYVAARR